MAIGYEWCEYETDGDPIWAPSREIAELVAKEEGLELTGNRYAARDNDWIDSRDYITGLDPEYDEEVTRG